MLKEAQKRKFTLLNNNLMHCTNCSHKSHVFGSEISSPGRFWQQVELSDMPLDLRQISTIIVSNKHEVHQEKRKSPEKGNHYFKHKKEEMNTNCCGTVQWPDNEQTAILKIPIDSTSAREETWLMNVLLLVNKWYKLKM